MAARRPVDVSGLVAHVREPALAPDAAPTTEKAPARPRKARSAPADPAPQPASAPRARARSGAVKKEAAADPAPAPDQESATTASAPKAPARKRATKATGNQKPAAPDTEQAPAPAERPEPPKPTVLAISTTEAKRIGLYLHPEDYRALGLARLDDGADANARIRAMIAVWRANPRFRHQVDRLARTAPRGNSR